jgi:hypothetical protein
LHLSASSSSATPQAFLPRIVTREIAAGARSIESIAFASAVDVREDQALRLASGTYNLLSTVGARPLLGRDFTKDDAAAKERALLLTYDTWRRRFGADPEIVGTVVAESSECCRRISCCRRRGMPSGWTASRSTSMICGRNPATPTG